MKNIKDSTKFHELVTKITVDDDGSLDSGLFQHILPWIKGNRYLRVIQKKLRRDK